MRTQGAVIATATEPGNRVPLEIVDLDLEAPQQGELLVKMVAAGLCHSDDHLAAGDIPPASYPFAVGHEGAGIVEEVGPYTSGYEVGDHVVLTFLPACGRCRWCASGMSNLCDLGRYVRAGTRSDGTDTYRMHLPDGSPVGQMAGVSTFSRHTTVAVASAVKVDRDLPLELVCLLGCGVGTGWGSAVYSAEVRAGHTVVVVGVGGVGMNAVQGAAQAGAAHVIAVDPVAMKREVALKLGATHAFADIAEAREFAQSRTNGQGADSAILTVGVLTGEDIAEGFAAIRKAGTVVVTGLTKGGEIGIPISPNELVLYQKRIQGALFGATNAAVDVPRQAQMYRDGTLQLEPLLTSTYALDQINQGYADMHAGLNIRGVIMFDR